MTESIKPKQFWLGTIITIGTVIVGIWQTRVEIQSAHQQTMLQIEAQAQENQRVHASNLLKELSVAINDICGQLSGHASMFFEMEGCLQTVKEPSGCWRKSYSFDPLQAKQAWDKLDAGIQSASPFLETKQERDYLREIGDLRVAYQTEIRPLLPPTSSSEAQAIRVKILMLRDTLLKRRNDFESTVSGRARIAQ